MKPYFLEVFSFPTSGSVLSVAKAEGGTSVSRRIPLCITF